MIGRLLFIFILVSSMKPSVGQSLSTQEILDNMFRAIDDIQTLRFKLKKQERVNNTLKLGEQDVKFNKSPKKIYTYIQAPHKGIEVLYLEGKNNGNAHVNPNAFPYINLNLDPYGSVMRKENHHTVNEVGFEYIKKIVRDIQVHNAENFEKIFKQDQDVKFSGRDCYKIIIDYYPFKFVPYTVKEHETVTDIAYKLGVSDYMILEYNKEVEGYTDVTAGQEIMVPNAYARKTVIYIDKITFLPVVQTMYDEKGLFEQYEFYNIIINSKIADEEFTTDFKGYGF